MAYPEKQESPHSGAVHITIGRPEGISQEVKKVSGGVRSNPRRGKEESFVKQPYPCRGCRMKFVTGGNICIAYYDYVSSGGMRLPHCSADMRRDVIQILKERKESHEAV